MTTTLPQPPTFEQWIENAFAGVPWEREPLFWQIENPDGTASNKYYCPLAPVLAEYLARLFGNPEPLIDRYSGDQLNKGFWFIAGIESSYFHTAREPNVPLDLQVRWVTAIGTLYEKLFAPLCTPHLGHLNEGPAHPLNSAVYMFWDMDTLGPDDERAPHLTEPIFNILERALSLDSVACQESALHGLGENESTHPERVRQIIDAYLRNNPGLPDDLREYAEDAREGNVL